MSDYEMIHLKGLYFSGRAVKFTPLDPEERDEVLLQAGKAMDAESTMIEMKRQEWKLGVLAMVKMVSDPIAPGGDPLSADVKWTKLTAAALDERYKELFTAKDHAALTAVFRAFHEVSEQEINAIVGKVLTVSGA